MPEPLDAEDLFDEFLAKVEEGAPEDFETFLARHPDHADELREIYDSWGRLEARLESALPEQLVDESFFHGTEPGQGLTGAEPRPPPAEPGAVIADDYRLLRLLGQGGMGAVWEAEQLSLGRRVALKLVRPGRQAPGVPALLGREARAGGRLTHPGLVTVHAAGEADGVHYIAQELVGDGFTLADFIERRRAEPAIDGRAYRKLAQLFAEVAEAVHAAHEAGILHRDLKPSNILIGPDDRPKVSDFGLAHLADESALQARPGLLGTYSYMSPEQAGGDGITIDGRSDVFSLGAVFYEALSLRRAFDGDTGDQILRQVVHHDPPDPRTIRSRIPEDLALICLAALAKNRTDRYPTMAAFAADLRRFLADEPIRAKPQGLVTRALKWSRRHPAWTTGLVLVSLALVIISSLLLNEVTLRRDAELARQQADEAATEAERAADEAAAAALVAEQRAAETQRQSYLANLRAATLDLQQGRHAAARRRLAACDPARRGWEWRHAALQADLSALRLEGHTDTVTALASDATGARLVSVSLDGTLRLWDGASGQALEVHDLGRPLLAVAMAGRSGEVFVGGRDGALDVLTAEGLERLVPGGQPILQLAASDDGRRVALARDDGTATVLDRERGRADDLPRETTAPLSLALSADGRRLATADQNQVVVLYDLAGEEVPLEAPQRLVYWQFPMAGLRVALDGDGSHLLLGADDGSLILWDEALTEIDLSDPGSERTTPVAVPEAPASWYVSHDEGLLKLQPRLGQGQEIHRRDLHLSVDETGTVLLHDRPRGDALRPDGHAFAVSAVALAGDRGRILSASAEGGSLRLWDGASGALTAELTGFAPPLGVATLSADGGRVLAAGADHVVHVWSGGTTGAVVPLVHLDAPAHTVALDRTGRRLATASWGDRSARVWDAVSGALIAELPDHPIEVSALALSADGETVVTGSRDQHVRVWDASTGQLRTLLVGHGRGVDSVALDAAGTLIASGSHDNTVRLWDLPGGRPRAVLDGGRSSISSVALSADGSRLLAGSWYGTVRTWPLPEGEPLTLRRGAWADDGRVALSADGRVAAWASFQREEIVLWDAATGEELRRLTDTRSGVVALSLSGDGRRLLSAAAGDDAARFWDLETGEVLAVLGDHAGPLSALALGDTCGRVVTAARDGTVRLWESDRQRAVAVWAARTP